MKKEKKESTGGADLAGGVAQSMSHKAGMNVELTSKTERPVNKRHGSISHGKK